MSINEIISLDQITDYSKNKKLLLLDFYAPWCGPCRLMEPQLIFLSNKDQWKEVGFFKINVDKYANLAGKYKVLSLPTIIILKNNQEVERIIGFKPQNKIIEILRKHI